MSGLIAGAAVGAITLGYGIAKDAKANSKAKELANNRPQIKSSPYTADELALSKSELANPMSADTDRFLKEQQDSDTSNSISAILKGGGDVNNVAQIFDGSQRGNQRLALMKENLRLNKINNFMNTSRNAEQERQQQFQFNQWAPWADQAQANSAAKQGAQATISSGVNTLASGVVGGLSNEYNRKTMNDYLNKTGGSGGGYIPFSSPTTTAPAASSQSPQVGANGNMPALNLDFNNSSNSNIWNIPGNS